MADYSKVGIHPSYNSNHFPGQLKQEINRLSKVLNREITQSRQHFLMLRLPTTYRNLINLDITDDYSMGFASQPGFRASICSPFNFYDLDLDAETKLRIHPFTFMEGTLRDYMNTSADKALEIIKSLIKEVKDVNGTFIPIWHNESLSDKKRWTGWQKVYEEMIETALP
ncbi:MAG: polysaccharide deacetylase family protein [Bacteroidales bacterium]